MTHALAVAIASLSTQASELTVYEGLYKRAGWTTETIETSQHKALIVRDGASVGYVLKFEKWGSDLRRFPGSDPNFESKLAMSGSSMGMFLDTFDFRELAQFASKVGLDPGDVQKEVADRGPALHVSVKAGDSKVTAISAENGKLLIAALRKNGEILRTVYSAGGETVEELPFDTRMKSGVGYKNLFWLELESKANPLHTKYPVILRIVSDQIEVLFDHANGIGTLPFLPAFSDIVAMYNGSKKEMWDVWNYYEKDQGQAGLWFRGELRRPGSFELWSPADMKGVLGKLNEQTKVTRGLVYAKSGRFGVAQYYDDENSLCFAEFYDGELTDVKSLEEAMEALESTSTSSRWWAYNGVCRQFGLDDMIRILYSKRKLGV